MKRSPIQRHTPLSRSSFSHSVQQLPKRSRRMGSRTPKRAADERRYLKRSRQWLEGKACRLHADEGLLHNAEELHHAKGRIGALLLDERFWVPLCSAAHDFVTNHPTIAERRGYSVSRNATEDVA